MARYASRRSKEREREREISGPSAFLLLERSVGRVPSTSTSTITSIWQNGRLTPAESFRGTFMILQFFLSFFFSSCLHSHSYERASGHFCSSFLSSFIEM
jgi:hypothetical protein